MRCALLFALAACGPGVPPIAHQPPPPDRPVDAVVPAAAVATADGAFVFDPAASAAARRALFREVDTGTHVGAPNAPVPRWVAAWPAGHGYFAIHDTRATDSTAHTVVSVDLDVRRRVWQRHRGEVSASGLAAAGARIWLNGPTGVELLRAEDGATVATLPAVYWVDGTGPTLVLSSATSIAVHDPLDGAPICNVTVPPISALVVEGELVRISDSQAVSVRDCTITAAPTRP